MRNLVLLAPLFAIACDPSTGTDAFTGGNFAFQTTGVTDACYDGAFSTIFMPEGTPADFGSQIYVPGAEELPATYTVNLSEPFAAMEVTVTGDEGTRAIAGAQNTDVELDPDAYPGCLVDASIDVNLVIDGPDAVHGTAVLHTSGFDDAGCPVIDSDPCDITLDISGTRAQ